jgi:hypothetical protein
MAGELFGSYEDSREYAREYPEAILVPVISFEDTALMQKWADVGFAIHTPLYPQYPFRNPEDPLQIRRFVKPDSAYRPILDQVEDDVEHERIPEASRAEFLNAMQLGEFEDSDWIFYRSPGQEPPIR